MNCVKILVFRVAAIITMSVVTNSLFSQLLRGYYAKTSSELLIQVEEASLVIEALQPVQQTLNELAEVKHAETP